MVPTNPDSIQYAKMLGNQKKWIAIIFGLASAVILLEVCCRSGIIPNQRFNISKAYSSGKNSFRVLILGDSFIAENSELNERFQRYFQKNGITCLNLARGGMRPIDYLLMLEKYGVDFSPNLVLLNYTTANDVTDTQIRTSPAELDETLHPPFPKIHFYLLETVQSAWTHWRVREDRRAVATMVRQRHFPGSVEARNPYLVLTAQIHADFMSTNLDLYSGAAKRAWETNERIFRKIRDICAANHMRLLINIFPATAQVNRSHYPFFTNIGFVMDGDLLKRNVLQDRFSSFCKMENILCNDLLPAFRQRADQEFYLEYDDHFNVNGQALAFSLIQKKIDELNLLQH